MLCSKCGTELPNDAEFCPNCGTPISNTSEPQFNSQTQSIPGGSAKKPKKGLIAGIIACVAVLAVGVTAFAQRDNLSNFIHQRKDSPLAYYKYVEGNAIDQSTDSITKSYGTSKSRLTSDGGTDLSIKMELGTALQQLLTLVPGNLSGLESGAFHIQSSFKGDDTYTKITGAMNDKEFLTTNVISNTKKQSCYMQIPELSKSYIDCSDSFRSTDDSDTKAATINSLQQLNNVLPEASDISAFYGKVSHDYLDQVSKVSKKSTTLSASSISEKCIALTVKYDKKTSVAIAKAIIKDTRDDAMFQKVFSAMYGKDSEQYKKFQGSMDEALQSADAYLKDDSFPGLTMIVYVDSNGKIIGRDIKADDDSISFTYHMPKKGSDFGLSMTLTSKEDSSTNMSLTGKGSISGDKLTGDFSATFTNPSDTSDASGSLSMIKAKVSDFDLKSMKNGKCSGTIELSSPKTAQIANYSLKIIYSYKGDTQNTKIQVINAKAPLGTITLTSKPGSSVSIAAPSSSAKIYNASDSEDMLAYKSELDLKKFLNDTKSKTGLNFDVDMIYGYLSDSIENK